MFTRYDNKTKMFMMPVSSPPIPTMEWSTSIFYVNISLHGYFTNCPAGVAQLVETLNNNKKREMKGPSACVPSLHFSIEEKPVEERLVGIAA